MTSVSYSLDNGTTWVTTQNTGSGLTITTPTVAQGDKVLWKGEGSTLYDSTFSSTGNFNVMGNIMSMLYGDNFENQTTFANGSERNFMGLFAECTRLLSAENLVLPAQTLTRRCYGAMFKDCTSLTTAPELPATTLANNCYDVMFQGCTSLTTAPELPATTLAEACYQGMFRDCTALTTAPELLLTTLTTQCYQNMFNGCTRLNYIKMLATDISASFCLMNWVVNVAASGIFVKDANTTIPTGTSGIPSGWTVLSEINA